VSKEKFAWRIARLLPRMVVRWAFIRVVSKASREMPTTAMSEITCTDAIRIWEDPDVWR
jgi:hypothetical protein